MILVDSAFIRAKLGRHPGNWCHMASDTSVEELISFGTSIGLKPEWLQNDRLPHFDIPTFRRHEAIKKGAVVVSTAELIHRCKELSNGS